MEKERRIMKTKSIHRWLGLIVFAIGCYLTEACLGFKTTLSIIILALGISVYESCTDVED